MKIKALFFYFYICLASIAHGQTLTQTIRGTITEQFSDTPVPFATIYLPSISQGTTADSLGNFELLAIPIGRYEIQVSFVGYEPVILKEVEVSTSKEVVLTIQMSEKSSLEEITITAKVNKEEAKNPNAMVSAKMLSVEEASRFAGGFDDPARLVASFAGVASSVNNNSIVVRGNAPKALQWRMEGVEISNPNHFADLAAFGGGGLSALSSQLLANSDFFSGAFPAEYSNALSGVFDMYMREGNSAQREHTFQVGLTGIDLSSEGYFKKGKTSSYLFNYRYATLSLLEPILPENGGGVKYQDLSFKLYFPTKKAGTFSLWGIGLLDRSGAEAKTDSTEWEYKSDKQKQDVKQYMAALGLSHKFYFGSKTFLYTTLATSGNGIDLITDQLDEIQQLHPLQVLQNNNLNIVLSSSLNSRLSKKLNSKTGIVLTNLNYDFAFKESNVVGTDLQTIVDKKGSSYLLTAYQNLTYYPSYKVSINVGLNTQLFTLNQNYTIEPRLGIKYQLTDKQALSLGYGLHSRLERLNYYFAQNPLYNTIEINKNLDFTKSHHIVLGYDISITPNLHFKAETYYQHLFDVPVVLGTSTSFINLVQDWFFNQKLDNIGKGRNYGIDISVDKYMTNGFYYMLTGSVFDSKYLGGDNIWRNTRFNQNFVGNFLIGKEWQLGKQQQKTLGINIRLSYQGGQRYTPINQTLSTQLQEVVVDDTQAFSKQISPAFTTHFTFNYKVNKLKTTREWSLKIINATMFEEFYGFEFNYKSQHVTEYREGIFIPNLSYRIEF